MFTALPPHPANPTTPEVGCTADADGNEYRYWVSREGIVMRSRIWQIGDDYDLWSCYWGGSDIAGFFNEYFRGFRTLDTFNSEDSERAMNAFRMAQNYDQDPHAALKRLAIRLTDHTRYDSDFIVVNIDRGRDLYVHSWAGDADGTWRDEIEALSMGDVWRDEIESYDPSLCQWMPEDSSCEEWYGEDNAREAWIKGWPLAQFPYEVVNLPIASA